MIEKHFVDDIFSMTYVGKALASVPNNKKSMKPPPRNARENIIRKKLPQKTRKRKPTTICTRITRQTYRKGLNTVQNEFDESCKEKNQKSDKSKR